jgi:hypothetical protein
MKIVYNHVKTHVRNNLWDKICCHVESPNRVKVKVRILAINQVWNIVDQIWRRIFNDIHDRDQVWRQVLDQVHKENLK